MKSDIISAMQKDMGILRYNGESQEEFIGRIVYSALCQWMRYIILDETTQNYDRKSKSYVLIRMKKILCGMMDAIPLCKKWIYGDLKNLVDLDELLKNLREKMLVSGELMEVDDNRNLGLPRHCTLKCTVGYRRIIGLSKDNRKVWHVGITRVLQNFDEVEEQTLQIGEYKIEEYLKWIYGGAIWNECGNIEQLEFFNPYSKKPPYQSWTSTLMKNENKHLARITLFNGMHEYYLVKTDKDKIYNCPLSAVLSDYKEERRVLLGLRKKVGNSMIARYISKGHIVVLSLYCRLPLKEKGVLDTYCWPLNSMEDNFNFVIPEFIWNDVKKNLIDNLGIDLKEKN